MATVALPVVQGPEGTVEILWNDVTNRWTGIRATFGQSARVRWLARGVSSDQIVPAGTTTFSFAQPIILSNTLNVKGTLSWLPTTPCAFGAGSP